MSRPVLLACGWLFLSHFLIVCAYAVDVPFIDEWEMLNPGGLSGGFSFRWLVEQYDG